MERTMLLFWQLCTMHNSTSAQASAMMQAMKPPASDLTAQHAASAMSRNMISTERRKKSFSRFSFRISSRQFR